MIKIKIFICANMMLSIVLAIYGQSISYYINHNIKTISPLYCLTVLTAISILLFFTTPIFVCKYFKKHNIEKDTIISYLFINFSAAVAISIFPLIILIMWWG